jgi:hypothetical protein
MDEKRTMAQLVELQGLIEVAAMDKKRRGWCVARHVDGRLSVGGVMLEEWREMHELGAVLRGLAESSENIEKQANAAQVTQLARVAREVRVRSEGFLKALADAPSLEELERIEAWACKYLPFPSSSMTAKPNH